MFVELVLAVVLIVMVNGAVDVPLTFSGLELKEQAVAAGSPEQAKVTDPEKLFFPVTARL
jgi:hypothetical protein